MKNFAWYLPINLIHLLHPLLELIFIYIHATNRVFLNVAILRLLFFGHKPISIRVPIDITVAIAI